jgi:hypothetical protein
MTGVSRIGACGHVLKLWTPKLTHKEDAADYVMEVQETGNLGV